MSTRYLIVCLLALLFCSFTSLSLSADFIAHDPWKLDGAEQRIQKYRTGKANLQLKLENGIKIPDNTPIFIHQKRHEFKFGGSQAQMWILKDHKNLSQYLKHFEELFNYVTVGFYWGWHERKRGQWKLKDHSKKSFDFAVKNNFPIRGHMLLWHNTLPKWLTRIRDERELEGVVEKHVTDLIKHYP